MKGRYRVALIDRNKYAVIDDRTRKIVFEGGRSDAEAFCRAANKQMELGV